MNNFEFPNQETIETLRKRFFVGAGSDEVFKNWGHELRSLRFND